MSEKVNVRITASQTVRYDQTVEMTRVEWQKLKSTSEDKIGDRDGVMTIWLDLRDVNDGDDFDVEQMIVVDDDDKPVKPRDEYEGDE